MISPQEPNTANALCAALGNFLMASSKYHREQAKLLAGLALSTKDSVEAELFQMAAREHLGRAQAIDDQDAVSQPPPADTAPVSSR
jgi:hypothetical protein